MLYPIVQIRERMGRPVVQWCRSPWHAEREHTDLDARESGLFVACTDFIDDDAQLADFQEAISEAWDAVRAIRHGTSLERFPRNLTWVSQATGEAQ